MESKQKYVILLKSKEYSSITKLAGKYKKKYKYFSGENEDYDKSIEKRIDRLKKSLEKKGFPFETGELKSFIYNEIIVLTYEGFKSKINRYKPKDFKEYITAFLTVFGEDYKEFMNYYHFKLLLSEQGIKYLEYTLKDEIMDVKRDLNL